MRNSAPKSKLSSCSQTVVLSTNRRPVHKLSSCPQTVVLFTNCRPVHEPSSCSQTIVLSTNCRPVHKLSSCPQTVVLFTNCRPVHKLSSCPQTVVLSTNCRPVHKPPTKTYATSNLFARSQNTHTAGIYIPHRVLSVISSVDTATGTRSQTSDRLFAEHAVLQCALGPRLHSTSSEPHGLYQSVGRPAGRPPDNTPLLLTTAHVHSASV